MDDEPPDRGPEQAHERRHTIPRPRLHPLEVAFWAAPLAAFFVFPDRRVLGSQIFVYGLYALSLDLILGYAGILSLGHATFFGTGAYAAGLLARAGWSEPLSGLAAAGLVSAALGYAVGALVVPRADLARLMVTLGIGLMMYEVANQASSITGGVDGLSDMQPGKLFGKLGFGLDGSTAFLYAFAVLLGLFVFARRVVHSPFGLALRGIRENARRMPAVGVNVNRRLRAVFALAAGMAGVAGALLAETTQFVGIDTLGFQRSAEVLIILVFGGPGRLYGALSGAAVFLLAQDYLAGISPAYWQFWLGAVLVLLVLVARGGLLGGLEILQRRLGRRFGQRAWRAR
jgi:branched-chain amino acid transport system permease protein